MQTFPMTDEEIINKITEVTTGISDDYKCFDEQDGDSVHVPTHRMYREHAPSVLRRLREHAATKWRVHLKQSDFSICQTNNVHIQTV